MGLISPGGENLLDFLELQQVLSTYDGDLRDRHWWPKERPVPLNHGNGRETLLLQLRRKAYVHAPLETRTDSPGETPEVPQDPCQHWRGILRFQH